MFPEAVGLFTGISVDVTSVVPAYIVITGELTAVAPSNNTE